MTEIEEKSLKVQMKLLKEINEANSMILNIIQGVALQVLKDVVEPKRFIKEEQTTIELTVEEFDKIRICLTQLSSEEGFCLMNSWIKEKYIEPKKEKNKIVSMLQ